MRRDLKHLPAHKRRELERVVAIIFEEFEDALAHAKHPWKKRGRIEKIILYGSYAAHKDARFPAADNKVIAKNPAFDLSDQITRDRFARAYAATSALYYRGQPSLDDILGRIQKYAHHL